MLARRTSNWLNCSPDNRTSNRFCYGTHPPPLRKGLVPTQTINPEPFIKYFPFIAGPKPAPFLYHWSNGSADPGTFRVTHSSNNPILILRGMFIRGNERNRASTLRGSPFHPRNLSPPSPCGGLSRPLLKHPRGGVTFHFQKITQ